MKKWVNNNFRHSLRCYCEFHRRSLITAALLWCTVSRLTGRDSDSQHAVLPPAALWPDSEGTSSYELQDTLWDQSKDCNLNDMNHHRPPHDSRHITNGLYIANRMRNSHLGKLLFSYFGWIWKICEMFTGCFKSQYIFVFPPIRNCHIYQEAVSPVMPPLP